MLNDFSKINTFLTVIRERSFSKAASKLGISQPAITQQMNFIEDFLNMKILNRKKNGIELTKEGQQFYNLCIRLERTLKNYENDLFKIINKEFVLNIGSSFVIGNYVLPRFLNDIKQSINNDVNISVGESEDLIQQLLDKKIDLAITETPVENSKDLIVKEWIEDEIVIFSNQKLPAKPTSENLLSYKWVCRSRDSHTRHLFKENLDRIGYADCDSFNMISESSSPTTILQTVKYADVNDPTPTCSVISLHAIKEQVNSGEFYFTRLPRRKMKRKFYISYNKDSNYKVFIESVIGYLNSIGNKVKL